MAGKLKREKMEAKWLIEDYEHDGSLQPLMDEVISQGMDLKIIKHKAWGYLEFDQYLNEDCVVFYGTLNTGRQIQRQKGWVPGVYCNFQNFCCSTYYSYWAKYLLNKNYIMLPLLEIKRQENYIFDNFGIDNCIFIRPNSGSKTFPGQILKQEEINKQFDLFEGYAGKSLDQIIAIISSPKVIKKEWRCIVVDKKVIAFSQYIENDELNIKKEINTKAFSLAEKIAKEEWQPDIAYTLDICEFNEECFLLEANSFSCSGLYKSDTVSIVKEVSKVALKEWKEYNE